IDDIIMKTSGMRQYRIVPDEYLQIVIDLSSLRIQKEVLLSSRALDEERMKFQEKRVFDATDEFQLFARSNNVTIGLYKGVFESRDPVLFSSYNHELSKYLYDIIKNNRPSQSFSYIRDSFECVKVTTGIPNSVNQTMISFDVDNLYTNVPVHEAIVTTLYMLFKTSKSLDAAYTRFQFGELIKIAVCDIPFRFQDKIYMQIDGVVMGSPLGPIFLHLFMSNFEQKINRFSTNKLLTWIRYVDDIFYIFDKQQSIKEFLKRINKWHHNIKFTSEKGSDALKENKKLVYKIPCSNCNKCHLGETNREKEIRMKEHQADIKNHTQCSNVAKHANENKHSLNFI
ncbi:unnamed protein product, partial [Rotaria socialis]